MTHKELLSLLDTYVNELHRYGYSPIEGGIPLNHAYWLCLDLKRMTEFSEMDLANTRLIHVLGTIQGIFIGSNLYTLKELRDHNGHDF